MATAAGTATPTVGPLLRDWRQRRRLSQLDVSARAAISTAVDITLAELSIESFFPADASTAATLRAATAR